MIILHLGCGSDVKEGYINIDSRPHPGVYVRDVLRGLPFSDETVDGIYSENFLEHIPQDEVIWIMNEMHRVLKHRAQMRHLIPEAGTTMDYQDPTHLSRWCMETFTYFTKDHRRNQYYGGMILPWDIVTMTHTVPNRLLDVTMGKP